jgi:hypothetical protein
MSQERILGTLPAIFPLKTGNETQMRRRLSAAKKAWFDADGMRMRSKR